jgi:hypothetical protein
MAKERTFDCPDCGESNKAYPPDEVHDTVSLDEKYARTRAEGTVIKVIHECEECIYPISIYWYRQKH